MSSRGPSEKPSVSSYVSSLRNNITLGFWEGPPCASIHANTKHGFKDHKIWVVILRTLLGDLYDFVKYADIDFLSVLFDLLFAQCSIDGF